MNKTKQIISLAACLLAIMALMTATPALAGHHCKSAPDKTGILLVAFGTTVPEAQAAFKNVEEKVKAAFPDIPIRWAYTSNIIRNKLAKQGQVLDSPAIALAKMADEGFTKVAIQSLHTIPGEEYTYLRETAEAFSGLPKGIKKIMVGTPLLYSPKDMEKATEALLTLIPKDRKPEDAVIFMGHGTPHSGNAYYPAIQYYLWEKDPMVFVATVEGAPTLDSVMAGLKKGKVKKAYLIPFMAVAGDHATNDMAGDEDDSFKSILTKAGIKCVPILKGTAEDDAITALWIGHLKTALAHLK